MHRTYFLRPALQRIAALMMLASLAPAVHAQYMWVDAKGIKQFSDRPPPTSVPLSHILKAPKGQPSADTPSAADPGLGESASTATAPTGAKAAKPRPTIAEREADFSKRLKDNLEKDKKERDENAARTAQAENCARARAGKATLATGTRISSTDQNGERTVMDEQARAAEGQRLEQILAGCKGG